MKFGELKTIVENKLTKSFVDSNLKKDLKIFNNLLKVDKSFAKMMNGYDTLNENKGISKEVVNTFEANMKEAGKNISLYRYEAGHGFANPSNPVFNKDAAADAHTKAIQFLKDKMK